jgi:Immunity protein 35
MTEEDARRVAASVLSERFREFRTGEWVLANVEEYETAWAFTYNDRRFVESGELRHALAGNGALVVPKSGADPWFAWSGADTASQVAIGRSALDR